MSNVFLVMFTFMFSTSEKKILVIGFESKTTLSNRLDGASCGTDYAQYKTTLKTATNSVADVKKKSDSKDHLQNTS